MRRSTRLPFFNKTRISVYVLKDLALGCSTGESCLKLSVTCFLTSPRHASVCSDSVPKIGRNVGFAKSGARPILRALDECDGSSQLSASGDGRLKPCLPRGAPA